MTRETRPRKTSQNSSTKIVKAVLGVLPVSFINNLWTRSNLWINIDTLNKLVIACESIGDIQCTNEEDNNFNTVEYYKTKEELLESMITVASHHKRRLLERHFKTQCDAMYYKIEIKKKRIKEENSKNILRSHITQ